MTKANGPELYCIFADNGQDPRSWRLCIDKNHLLIDQIFQEFSPYALVNLLIDEPIPRVPNHIRFIYKPKPRRNINFTHYLTKQVSGWHQVEIDPNAGPILKIEKTIKQESSSNFSVLRIHDLEEARLERMIMKMEIAEDCHRDNLLFHRLRRYFYDIDGPHSHEV